MSTADGTRFRKILLRWSGIAPDEMLEWVARNAPGRLSSSILDVAQGDFEKAIPLYRKFGKTHPEVLQSPHGFASRIAIGKRPAADLLVLARTFIAKGTPASLTVFFPWDFSADYDFETAMNGLAEVHSSLAVGETITLLPKNLLATWVLHHPAAAAKWVSKGNVVPGNGMKEFLAAMSRVGPPETVGRIAATLHDPNLTEQENHHQLFRFLCENPSEKSLREYLRQKSAFRRAALADLFDSSTRATGGRFDVFSSLVLRVMTPDERISVITNEFRGVPRKPGQRLIGDLKALGHSDAEIQQMTSPPPP
ncbi:MAG: hypothetical protein V4733_12680 [Verrucomicrobiota bacterium]